MTSSSSVFGSSGGGIGSNVGTLPRWDLSALYNGMASPEIDEDLDQVAAMAKEFAGEYEDQIVGLSKSAGGGLALGEAIEKFEAIEELEGRLSSFADLLYAENSTDPAIAKFYTDVRERLTQIHAGLIFFSLELNDIDERDLKRLYEELRLAKYKPYLDSLRDFKPYQMSKELETFSQEKSLTARSAWVRLFDDTAARLKFPFQGAEKNVEEILSLQRDTNPKVREEAAESAAAVLGQNNQTFALIMNTVVRDKATDDKWRKLPDMAMDRHLANQVEPEVVAALSDAVSAAYPRTAHRYYKMKAKWFGVEALNYWDRNAPLPQADSEVISWSEAHDIIMSSYGSFSADMANTAKQFFDRNWIDAEVRAGKSSGAFSHPTVPSAHPFILMSYQGKVGDVMTLAHELGHGVHQVLAADQGALLANTPLTLAETASVFGEMLTFKNLLSKTTSKAARRHLIASKVEDMLNTCMRQIAFYTFERRIHEARAAGELTTDDINRIWLDLQGESLGPAVKQNPGYENYWCYISHFIHVPFYVYAYAFGDCLVNSLFAVYENAEDGFQEKYFEMLKAGGSKRHKELLAPFGLDASEPEFWQKGLSVIEGLIYELEKLEE